MLPSVGFMGLIEEFIGDLRNIPRCRITGRVLYKAECLSVPRSNSEGVMVSVRALEVASPLEIAHAVLSDVDNEKRKGYYSAEYIASLIPDKCIRSVPFP